MLKDFHYVTSVHFSLMHTLNPDTSVLYKSGCYSKKGLGGIIATATVYIFQHYFAYSFFMDTVFTCWQQFIRLFFLFLNHLTNLWGVLKVQENVNSCHRVYFYILLWSSLSEKCWQQPGHCFWKDWTHCFWDYLKVFCQWTAQQKWYLPSLDWGKGKNLRYT